MTLRVHPDEIVRISTASLLAIHESWERVRLGDIADVLNGFAFKSQFFGDTGVPLLRIRDVGKSDTGTMYSGEYDEAYLVQPAEIVVGMDGDFRVALWSGRPALLNQRVCKITVRDAELYEPHFLLYALPGYLDAVNAHTSSVTVKHLSSRTVQDIPLPLPPLNEQRRIVAAIEEHLSRLDAADASITQAEKRLGAFEGATMASAVGGHELVELGSVTSAHRYGTSVKCLPEAHGPAVLRIPNIRGGWVDTSDLKFATTTDLGDAHVESGDLLVIRTNGSRDLIGRVGVVDGAAGMAFASYLIRARPSENLDPKWAVIALSSPRLRAEIESRAASTAGQYNLNLRALKSLRIPLPPIEEQRRIVQEVEARLSAIDALRSAIERAQRRSAALRRAVLERAFRGELVPQDPSDEPAETLLAGIRADLDA